MVPTARRRCASRARRMRLVRNGAEHPFVLRLGVRHVLAERRDDANIRLGVAAHDFLVDPLGDLADPGVRSCEVRWQQKHPVELRCDTALRLVHQLNRGLLDLFFGDGVGLDGKPGHTKNPPYRQETNFSVSTE